MKSKEEFLEWAKKLGSLTIYDKQLFVKWTKGTFLIPVVDKVPNAEIKRMELYDEVADDLSTRNNYYKYSDCESLVKSALDSSLFPFIIFSTWRSEPTVMDFGFTQPDKFILDMRVSQNGNLEIKNAYVKKWSLE